ncbi:AAA family ATPase [Posidoniimonas polymericola]|uniref:AAA family ATPase n=1 Tax=Posidoniimonas polymericola TaxID=2528002 RepID=UPI001E61F1AD|nr:AAA family ATPase [Posidoniimonas polymericola]
MVQIAAKNQGVCEIVNRPETRGPAIRAGNDKLFDANDHSYAMRCCETIPHLIELRLLKVSGGAKRFELTNFGWQLSRKLTAAEKAEDGLLKDDTKLAAASHSDDQHARTQPLGDDRPLSALLIEELSETIESELESEEQRPAVEAPEQPQLRPPRPARREVPDFGMKQDASPNLVAALGLDDGFLPPEPQTLEETGLTSAAIEDLILKVVQNAGSMTGRQISDVICLPLAILEDCFTVLRNRQYLSPTGSAMLGDYVYQLTDSGRERARLALKECAYAGPAPVPLEDYVDSVHAQTIRTEKPKRPQLEKAFSDINVEPEMLAQLGPAISAGRGMFIYGPPGNGKTTIAQRITRCFGQNILVPHAIVEDGQIIKLYDASCHETVESKLGALLKECEHDRRWVRIKRPTVVVGGELTMDSLELKHDPVSHISEASLQLKSNCGSLLIDDFGRQRVNPTDLLNRWIVPLENRIDYLGLANGKKIQVPFEQLIIFSTNLEPHDLADDAFLRRIPFKIEIGAPSREEFAKLFSMFAKKLKVECPPECLEYLLASHYDACGRPLRRCQARDLLDQASHFCEYNELPPVATPEILDHAVKNYFTALEGTE